MAAPQLKDPMENIVGSALTTADVAFTRERDPVNKMLDFHLTDYGVHVEVKQFHSGRTQKQIERSDNIILIVGLDAAKAFAKMILHPETR